MAFNIQLEFSPGRKHFAIKKMASLERAGKNLSISVLGFFFKNAAYDYERVNQSAFYAKKAPRALGGPFLLDVPIYATTTTAIEFINNSRFFPFTIFIFA